MTPRARSAPKLGIRPATNDQVDNSLAEEYLRVSAIDGPAGDNTHITGSSVGTPDRQGPDQNHVDPNSSRHGEFGLVREERIGAALGREDATEPDPYARLIALEQEVARLRRRLGIAPYPPVQQQLAEIAQAGTLEQQGVLFERSPEKSYPGAPYVTPSDLVKQRGTLYTVQNLRAIIRNGELSPGAAGKLGGNTVIYPQGVVEIQERERRQAADPNPSRRPGSQSGNRRRRLS